MRPTHLHWKGSAAAAGNLQALLIGNAESGSLAGEGPLKPCSGGRACYAWNCITGPVYSLLMPLCAWVLQQLKLHHGPSLFSFNATVCLSLSADFSRVSPCLQWCKVEQLEAASSPWREDLPVVWAARRDASWCHGRQVWPPPAQTTPVQGTIAASHVSRMKNLLCISRTRVTAQDIEPNLSLQQALHPNTKKRLALLLLLCLVYLFIYLLRRSCFWVSKG